MAGFSQYRRYLRAPTQLPRLADHLQLSRGIVASWSFANGTAHDLGSHSYHGVKSQNVSMLTTRYGRAAYHNVTQEAKPIDLGLIAANAPLAFSGGVMSFFALIKPYAWSDNYMRLFEKGNAGYSANGYGVVFRNNGAIQYYVDGSTDSLRSHNGVITLNNWHSVGGSISGTNGQVYVDGIDQTLNWLIGATIPTAAANMSLMGWNHSASRVFTGHLALLHMWNRVLRADEQLWLSKNPFGLYERRIWVPTGEAPPPVITGTGALQAQDATVVGVGEVFGIIAGTGTLQAQDAAVVGVGDVAGANIGTGTLQAQGAQVSGVGAVVHDGSGTLQAQPAAIIGVGEVGNVRTGAGVLQADEAVVAGTGARISVGSGALQAQDAAVSGAGVVEGLTSGTGALQAQDAAVAGTGHLIRVGSGALQAQAAQVAGIGAILGEITLSPADIAAIADAVYAKLVSEGLVQQINEVWQRRGLDPANPQTYDKAGNEIRVGNITIDLSGDPSSVTQTRQP